MASRTTEIGSIGKEIQSLEELRDFAAITADLYETKRENAVLDAQLSEVLERQRFLASVKSKLDEAVRKSIERQAAERKAMIDAIMAGVMTELEDVKLQDRILKKCLFDLENVPSVQQARI
jgi:ATP-dependent protease HslVU (ClpYQ) ATPase subunit